MFAVAMTIAGGVGFYLSLQHYAQPAPQASAPLPAAIDSDNVNRTLHYPLTFVSQLKNDPSAGEKIYHEFCYVCHDPEPIVDIKAPRLNEPEKWAPFAKLSKDSLVNLVAQGVGGMPARGGCFECSDAQLQQTIEYMLAQVKAKTGAGAK